MLAALPQIVKGHRLVNFGNVKCGLIPCGLEAGLNPRIWFSAYFPFWIFWLAYILVRLNVLVSLSFGSRAFIVHDVNFIAG